MRAGLRYRPTTGLLSKKPTVPVESRAGGNPNCNVPKFGEVKFNEMASSNLMKLRLMKWPYSIKLHSVKCPVSVRCMGRSDGARSVLWFESTVH